MPIFSKENQKLLNAFGDLVREHRNKQGLSQEELAEYSGLHRTYIGSIERGERNLALININRISKALNVKPSDLLPDNSRAKSK